MLTRRRFLTAVPGLLAASYGAPWLWAGRREGNDRRPESAPPLVSPRGTTPDLAPAQLVPLSSQYCKLLQFTDLHFFQKTSDLDELTLKDCRQQIEWHKPDAVVITGDAWHRTADAGGLRGLEFLVRNAAAWEVPWAFCWGNHDQLDDPRRGQAMLESAPHSLYHGGSSQGHYRVEVRPRTHGPGARPPLDLLFLNSETQGLGASSVAWLRTTADHLQAARSPPVPALAFFHIPILEYESRIAGSNFRGVKLEGLGPLPGSPAAYAALTASKTIRACFCGHCHANDYVVKTGEIDLVFGRSSGHAGFGGENLRKGAKLIEVELATGSYQQRTVFADGSEWLAHQPEAAPGTRRGFG